MAGSVRPVVGTCHQALRYNFKMMNLTTILYNDFKGRVLLLKTNRKTRHQYLRYKKDYSTSFHLKMVITVKVMMKI